MIVIVTVIVKTYEVRPKLKTEDLLVLNFTKEMSLLVLQEPALALVT